MQIVCKHVCVDYVLKRVHHVLYWLGKSIRTSPLSGVLIINDDVLFPIWKHLFSNEGCKITDVYTLGIKI